jgi:hypothetical protein
MEWNKNKQTRYPPKDVKPNDLSNYETDPDQEKNERTMIIIICFPINIHIHIRIHLLPI